MSKLENYQYGKPIRPFELYKYLNLPIVSEVNHSSRKYTWAGILTSVNPLKVAYMMPLSLDYVVYDINKLIDLKWKNGDLEKEDYLAYHKLRMLTNEEFKRFKTYVLGRRFMQK